MSEFIPVGTGVQTSTGRLYNRRIVLSHVALNPGISVADLSRQSHLAPQTVSSLVDELQSSGLLQVGDPVRGKRGQPARPLRTNPEGAFAMGVHVGRHHIEAVLMNLGGAVIDRYRRDFAELDREATRPEIEGISDVFAARLQDRKGRLAGLGIALSDKVRSQMEPGILDDLERHTGADVSFIRPGSATTWAAYAQCPRPRPADFASIYIDWDVSSGIVLSGNLLEGRRPVTLERLGMVGGETLDDRVSLDGLKRELLNAGIHVPESSPSLWPWSQWVEITESWCEMAAKACASALVSASHIAGVDAVAIDGNLPQQVISRLADEAEAYLRANAASSCEAPHLHRASQGSSGPAVGAAYLVLFRKYFSRSFEGLATPPAD